VGKAVKKKNRIQGKGGRKLCNFCKTAGKGKAKAKPKRKVKRVRRPKRRPKRRRR
jgi:hypothetical protein